MVGGPLCRHDDNLDIMEVLFYPGENGKTIRFGHDQIEECQIASVIPNMG